MDNTQYLKDIADAEKRAKQTELDQAKASALKTLDQEQAKLAPQYTQKRQDASVASQLGAKNLAEYWANRGQSTSGISAQAEMNRNNMLNRDINTINVAENTANQDINTQKGAVNTDYNNNLANAYNTIDSELSKNLYNEKVRQAEAEAAAKQQAFENSLSLQQLALSKYNAYKGDSATSMPDGQIKVVNGVVYTSVNNKWVKQTYAKDKLGNTVNAKTEKFNKLGYGLTNQLSNITYKDSNGKNQQYAVWQKDNIPYVIMHDVAVPLLSGLNNNKTNNYNIVKNAAQQGLLTKEQVKVLSSQLGI